MPTESLVEETVVDEEITSKVVDRATVVDESAVGVIDVSEGATVEVVKVDDATEEHDVNELGYIHIKHV